MGTCTPRPLMLALLVQGQTHTHTLLVHTCLYLWYTGTRTPGHERIPGLHGVHHMLFISPVLLRMGPNSFMAAFRRQNGEAAPEAHGFMPAEAHGGQKSLLIGMSELPEPPVGLAAFVTTLSAAGFV